MRPVGHLPREAEISNDPDFGKEVGLVAVGIQIGYMKVGSMQSDVGVFFGENIQNGWDSHSKTNTAGMTANGDYNYMPSFMNTVNDADWIDAPINDQDVKSPTYAHIMGI
jgi:hypothetical protein